MNFAVFIHGNSCEEFVGDYVCNRVKALDVVANLDMPFFDSCLLDFYDDDGYFPLGLGEGTCVFLRIGSIG